MTTATKDSEAKRLSTALDALAEVGGRLLRDDDITFGKKFVIPEHMSLDEAWKHLRRRAQDEEQTNEYERVYNYRPYDGAIAAEKALRQAFGFTSQKAVWGMWGSNPPSNVEVEIDAYGNTQRVPWGTMSLPLSDSEGNSGTAEFGLHNSKEYGQVFKLTVYVARKWRYHVEGLFRLVDKFLKEESIYRGKALDVDGHFIDTRAVDASLLVYTDSVQRRLEGDLWSFIRYEQQLAAEGLNGKHAVLLHGPFGSGKTEAAGVTAQIANDHGWTFLMCRPGKDNLQNALQMGRLYEPAIIFAEDIDTRTGNDQSAFGISEALDMLDGFHTKGQKLITVFTTNHAEKIHKGMLRPGRIGAVIKIAEMDRAGVEKLARRVIGVNMDTDVDFDKVYEAMDGYMPAFVKEAFAKAVRYSISANKGVVGRIGTQELVDAAVSLREQKELMDGAKTEASPDRFEKLLTGVVTGVVDSTKFLDHNGEERFSLTVGTNGKH